MFLDTLYRAQDQARNTQNHSVPPKSEIPIQSVRSVLKMRSKGKQARIAYQRNEMEKIRRAVEMLCRTRIYGLRRARARIWDPCSDITLE